MAKKIAPRTTASTAPELLHRLCVLHAGGKIDVSKLYKHCMTVLGSGTSFASVPDEFRLCERIQKKLAQQKREKDALRFMELYRRLKTLGLVQSRSSLLQFFLSFTHSTSQSHDGQLSKELLSLEAIELPRSLMPSQKHQLAEKQLASRDGSRGVLDSIPKAGIAPPATSAQGNKLIDSTISSKYSADATSGVGSWHSDDISARVPALSSSGIEGIPRLASSTPTFLQDSFSLHSSGGRAWSQREELDRAGGLAEGVSERVLLQELIFAFQGIDGKVIRLSPPNDGFRILNEFVVHPSRREHCHKLAELGWLYRKINVYIEAKGHDPCHGLAVQSFVSALSLEMTEYYRLVAVLEAQLEADKLEQMQSLDDSLTLRRLVVWTREPLERLKTLAILVDECRGLRGGALVSNIFLYARHGDPKVQATIKHILDQVYKPINSLLNSWIFEGQLQDGYNEFFVAANQRIPDDKLWKCKYSIRTSMLPKFISEQLANKILIVGKSINFLRQQCQDHTQLFSDKEKAWFTSDIGECTFDGMTGPALDAVVDATYKRTSKYLLEVINKKYLFLDHLKAFRKYLLLGQGDFIQHLMDIIQTELTKPATLVYQHNLTAILESAIRATNTQYEHPDVLNRLDVQVLHASPGDCGWDVFTLLYRVVGPISTIFTEEVMLQYMRVFNLLWRSKRIEFSLAGIWRNQITYSRQLVPLLIKDVGGVMHQCQLLTGALVHFMSQLQYYIMFECLECCWAELLKDIGSAADLDKVIDAQVKFLKEVFTRCLLDEQSQMLMTQLRTLFDLIVDYSAKHDAMFKSFVKEAERRRAYERRKQDRAEEGIWGETEDEAEAEESRRKEFVQNNVMEYQGHFTYLEDSFKDTLKAFLALLDGHLEENLRFLARRLDFNRFYSHFTPRAAAVKKI